MCLFLKIQAEPRDINKSLFCDLKNSGSSRLSIILNLMKFFTSFFKIVFIFSSKDKSKTFSVACLDEVRIFTF